MKPLLWAVLLGFSSVSFAETPAQSPLVWKDSASGILFYVESDGLHASAIDRNGKLLWCTNMTNIPLKGSRPFAVKQATEIRGSPGLKSLEISFGATDSVVLDITTGKVVVTFHD